MGAPSSSSAAGRFWWPDAPGPELTVAELLASRVELRGDATALIAPSLLARDEAGRAETFVTYAELRERAASGRATGSGSCSTTTARSRPRRPTTPPTSSARSTSR
jgi:hypothetical protein